MKLILAALVVVACTKAPEEIESDVEIDYFLGAWTEYYGPDYRVEGSRTWYIEKDLICVSTYDWYSDTKTEENLRYSLERKGGKYIVVLQLQEQTGTGSLSFYIVKLTDEEMIWQRVDSEKALRHFVNGKYWKTHQR